MILGGKGTLSIKQDNLAISPSCTVIFSGDFLNTWASSKQI